MSSDKPKPIQLRELQERVRAQVEAEAKKRPPQMPASDFMKQVSDRLAPKAAPAPPAPPAPPASPEAPTQPVLPDTEGGEPS